jgi:hypothetical protein
MMRSKTDNAVLCLNVKIETIPTDVYMIIVRTIDITLRNLDSEIFASDPKSIPSVAMGLHI